MSARPIRPRMTSAGRLRWPLGVLLLLVAALAGCTSAGTGTAGPAAEPSIGADTATSEPAVTAPTETTAAPTRRTCYRLRWAQVLAPTDDAAPLRCARSHTAETYAVGTLKTLVDGHLLAVDSTAVQAQVAQLCPRRLAVWAGGEPDDLRLSMLRPVWFTPTLAESDAGANWFRCDVVAVARDGVPAAVRGSLRGVLADADRAEDYAMCGTAQPGSPGFERVVCRADHSWRAVAVVDLTDTSTDASTDASTEASTDAGGTAYPGRAVVRAAGQQVCEDTGRRVADDALDFSWGYEWPTAQQWASGQTYGRCWAPDRS